jgi:hypothetical protein
MKTYIQIGTANGNDYFYKFIELLNPDHVELILVEPIQYELSDEFYKKTLFKYSLIKKAVMPNGFKKSTAELYTFGNDFNLSSALNRMAIKPTGIIHCPAITIDELLKLANYEIELLSVDTEGLDLELLSSIDYTKYKINNIFFEYWNFEDDANGQYHTQSLLNGLDEKLFNAGFNQKEIIMTDGNTNYLYKKKTVV